MQWAMKAFQHAEIHFNVIGIFFIQINYSSFFQLLSAIDPKLLKLTKIDDIIYEDFRQLFKSFQVDKINVDLLKSAEQKEVSDSF